LSLHGQLLNFESDDDPDPAFDSGADPDPGADQNPDLQNWFLLSYFHALIKKKIKFTSYIRKFRVEQLQSHI
jgi:hypothetical protein